MTEPDARESTLVIDAANVVGSRPDGWWRDRPGAAARLHEAVSAAYAAGRLEHDTVVLVLEGQARAGVAADAQRGDADADPVGDGAPVPGGVRVVHARASGDDTIAAEAGAADAVGQQVTVVTADRGLRARLPSGATAVGPGWLRDRLE